MTDFESKFNFKDVSQKKKRFSKAKFTEVL